MLITCVGVRHRHALHAELPPELKTQAGEYDRAMETYDANIAAIVKADRDAYLTVLTTVRKREERAKRRDAGFIFSPDLGKTWAQYDLKEFGDRSGVRVNPPNSDGWFRLCLREKWMNRAEVLFIKPVS